MKMRRKLPNLKFFKVFFNYFNWFFLIFFFTFILLSCRASQNKIEKASVLYNAGVTYMERGEFDKALDDLMHLSLMDRGFSEYDLGAAQMAYFGYGFLRDLDIWQEILQHSHAIGRQTEKVGQLLEKLEDLKNEYLTNGLEIRGHIFKPTESTLERYVAEHGEGQGCDAHHNAQNAVNAAEIGHGWSPQLGSRLRGEHHD